MSNPGKTQAFGKNNEFLKTFKHYKHYHDWRFKSILKINCNLYQNKY
jgi:hypothetical protein